MSLKDFQPTKIAAFVAGGLVGLLLIQSSSSWVHGLILFISPNNLLLYINAFWSYGFLSILLFRILSGKRVFPLKLLICGTLIMMFFLSNHFAQEIFFRGMFDHLGKDDFLKAWM